MAKVELKYKPISAIPVQLSAKGTWPESWREMNQQQFVAMANFLMKAPFYTIEYFIHLYTGISRKMIRKMDDYQTMKVTELLERFDASQPYDDFKITLNNYLAAPQASLKDVSFGEFVYIDSYFLAYAKSKKEELLHKMLAWLYRPRDIRGNRIRLTEEEAEKHQQFIAMNIPVSHLFAVYFNYKLVRMTLEDQYIWVFPKIEGDKGKKGGTARGWVEVYDSIVGDDLVNEQKYSDMPVHKVLRYMDNQIKKQHKNGRK